MIIGIGVDQVEVRRMEELLRRHPERARQRLFTPGERELCDGRSDPAEAFAGRFAAKEAFLKALGTGWSGGISWRDVEVLGGPDERPTLHISGAAERRLQTAGGYDTHVSFTHDGGFATAVVVIEG